MRESLAASKRVHGVKSNLAEESNYTAMPTAARMVADDAYDAVAPDDLGAEWLTRAAEANVDDSMFEEPEPPELFLEAGMAVISEGSINAASAEQLEAEASAALEGTTDEDATDQDATDETSGGGAPMRALRAKPSWNRVHQKHGG
jgi:hypothetical protein